MSTMTCSQLVIDSYFNRNHELYVTDVAYETFNQFSKVYGDRYVTSNVQITNPATGQFENIGSKYRYFTTDHGLRIMAFGVLYDFTGNSNVSKVIKARDLVKESWFLDAVNYQEPIDLFILLGHNPVRTTASRYCETLGWTSMSGINSSTFRGNQKPRGVPNPTQKAIKVSNATSTSDSNSPSATSNLVYSRRYLDWNRLTFEYHAVGSQESTFDYHSGQRVTAEITQDRKQLNLTALYGCAPETYCQSCKPFGTDGNIFGLLQTALAATVVNESRADVPRLIIINTGTIRFDLVKGPFTFDDSFIVSPFDDAFQFIPNVPYNLASQVLGILNAGPYQKRSMDIEARDLSTQDFDFDTLNHLDACTTLDDEHARSHSKLRPRTESLTRNIYNRQAPALTPGYVTTDDFGTDEDEEVVGNNDLEVRREDQDKINKFSRLHQRETLLEEELKSRAKEKEDLEEVSNELELADEDEKIPYKIGDAFIMLPLSEVQELLSKATGKIEGSVSATEGKLSSVREEMESLKVDLYARFGKSINLET
ncbi:MAG: hypothetical protein Q9219_004717 [cf. Caloplaca sp. 3 TL-2023]